MYIYENHMGGFYSSDESLDYEDLYCAQCGDSDHELGFASTVKEALWLLLDESYNIEIVKEFIEREFGVNLKIPDAEPVADMTIKADGDKQQIFCNIRDDTCGILSDADEWEPFWCLNCAVAWMNKIEKLNSADVLNTCCE